MFTTGRITNPLFIEAGASIETAEEVIALTDEVMITLFPPELRNGGGWVTTYGLIGGNTWEPLTCVWLK